MAEQPKLKSQSWISRQTERLKDMPNKARKAVAATTLGLVATTGAGCTNGWYQLPAAQGKDGSRLKVMVLGDSVTNREHQQIINALEANGFDALDVRGYEGHAQFGDPSPSEWDTLNDPAYQKLLKQTDIFVERDGRNPSLETGYTLQEYIDQERMLQGRLHFINPQMRRFVSYIFTTKPALAPRMSVVNQAKQITSQDPVIGYDTIAMMCGGPDPTHINVYAPCGPMDSIGLHPTGIGLTTDAQQLALSLETVRMPGWTHVEPQYQGNGTGYQAR
jgi:hypothetical protein